jgi:translation initiation factor IF-1
MEELEGIYTRPVGSMYIEVEMDSGNQRLSHVST